VSSSSNPYVRRPAPPARSSPGSDGLADVLERVLDKGLVVAGDIQINLLDIELITIKVRLLLASADTAQQMGIDWWKHDPFLSGRDRELAQENAVLRSRVDALEAALGEKLAPGEPSPGDVVGEGAAEITATRGQTRPTGALLKEAREGSRSSSGSEGGEGSTPASGEAPSGAEVETEQVRVEPLEEGSSLRIETDDASGDDAIITEGSVRVSAADDEGDADDEDDEDDEDLTELTKSELQERLRERDLQTTGNKDTLIERLRTGRN
jgi:hypothetical protein